MALSIQKRKSLVERGGYTFGGRRCAVGGWRNDYATIAPATGGFYSVEWDEVEQAAKGTGDIPQPAGHRTSDLWIGTES